MKMILERNIDSHVNKFESLNHNYTFRGEKDNDIIKVYYFDQQSQRVEIISNQDIFLLAEELIDKERVKKSMKSLTDILLNLMVIKYQVDYISSLSTKKKQIIKDFSSNNLEDKNKEVKDYILDYINKI